MARGSRSGRPVRPPTSMPSSSRPWPPGRLGRPPAGAPRRCGGGPPRGCRAPPPGARRPRRRPQRCWRLRAVGAQTLGQLVGHPLRHFAGVDEHEGRAVLTGVLGDAVEDVGELAAAGHGLEFGVGELDRHIEIAGVPAVDDHRRRASSSCTPEEPGHHLERPLGAESPMRCRRPPASANHRGPAAPGSGPGGCRACPGQVWTSSTITVRTPRNKARDDGAVRRR